MDLVATSTCFFGVSDSEIQTSLLRLTAMETSWKIKISFEASSDMMLSNRRITKAQIGLRGSVPMLFKSRRQVFSHRDENMLTPFHGKFFCLDGLLIRRSKSKFLGTQIFFNFFFSPQLILHYTEEVQYFYYRENYTFPRIQWRLTFLLGRGSKC